MENRGIAAFLTKVLNSEGWKKETSQAFMAFYNNQFSPSTRFDTDALLSEITLKDHERQMSILRRWWGIGQDAESAAAIARDYGVTDTRIFQIKDVATRQLLRPSTRQKLIENLKHMGFTF